MGNKFMTVEQVSILWRELSTALRNRKREYLRLSIPEHSRDCICPLCLWVLDKLSHPRARLNIFLFFQACLLEYTQTSKKGLFRNNWAEVSSLLKNIWGKGNLSFDRPESKIYYYQQRVRAAIVCKKNLLGLTSSPQWHFYSSLRGKLCAISKIISSEDATIKRLISNCPDKGITLRDLLRRSNITLREFDRLLRVYDGEVGLMIGKGHRNDQIMVYPTLIQPKKHPLSPIQFEKKKSPSGRVTIYAPN